MALSVARRRILCTRKSSYINPCRNGYIILLPEVPSEVPEDPLLKLKGIPDMNSLTTEKCANAVKRFGLEFESAVWKAEEQIKEKPVENVFLDVLDPLEVCGAPLDTTWGLAKSLYLVNKNLMPAKTYMTIHDQARMSRATKFNSEPVFLACKEASLVSDLTEEQQRVVGKYTLEGRLNGLDLDSVTLAKLKHTNHMINNEKGTFKGKVETAVRHFQHTIMDDGLLREFPEHVLKLLSIDSSQPLQGPWKATLYPHVYTKFMEYCPDRDLRWNLWQANTRKASKHSGLPELQNSTHLEELRFLRKQQANYLGYNDFASMSMETKMAGSIENVKNMLASLLSKARPTQDRELVELQDFAVSRGFDGAIQLWDLPYWRRKQQNSLYGYNEEELKEYFPLQRVMSGLFTLCEQLFGIHIVERPGSSTWHPDVQYFDILESDSPEPVAGFYFDPYARQEKVSTNQDPGWMVALRSRSTVANTTPLASLIFNFAPPQEGKSMLLSFSDLQLLFKKFGYALQHLLTRTSYMEVSGLSNVEWDAIEACSNFMVHWLYDINTIELISGHFETGEYLPRQMFQQLCETRKHMSGFDLCKEIYLASLDLEIYSVKDFWLDIVKRLWPEHLAFPLDPRDSHPCSFTTIMCEEWAAAYYSHLWSQVMAADMFSAFVEAGLDNRKELGTIGRRFRSTFLAHGGGCHAGEVFRRFRGRDLSSKALLNALGLKQGKIEDVQSMKL